MSSEKDFINPFIPNKEIAKNYIPSPISNFTIVTNAETGITYTMMDMPLYDDLVTSAALDLSTLSTNQDILEHQQLEQEFWNGNT